MDGRIEGMVGFALHVDELGGTYAADIALTTQWVDLAAYRAYERHPLHLEVRAVVLELMESASTVDYTERPR